MTCGSFPSFNFLGGNFPERLKELGLLCLLILRDCSCFSVITNAREWRYFKQLTNTKTGLFSLAFSLWGYVFVFNHVT